MTEHIAAYRQFLLDLEAAMASGRCFHIEVYEDLVWVVVKELGRYGLGRRLRVVYTC